jgi:hypothetical protein
MAIQVQYRRGSASQNDVFTGALGEITVDTTNKTIRVHDGTTAGGSNIATVEYVDNAIGSLSANSITDGTSNVRINGANGNVTVSVGGTSNVAVIASSGINVTGTVSASGAVTGASFTGNGRALTSLSAANIDTGTLPSARLSGSYSISVTSATSATTAATVTTNAQPNITSVGTLSSLNVTANILAGNLIGIFNGNGANLNNLNASNISSGTLDQARLSNASVTLGSTALTLGATVTSVTGLSSVTSTSFVGTLTGAATTAGTVTTAAQPNITSVGTLTAATVTGNTTSGNLLTGGLISAAGAITGASFTGNGRALTSLNAANIDTGTLPSARLSGTYTITVSGAATTAGTVTTAAQPNITSVGTLSALSVSGNTTSGNFVTAGLVNAGSLQTSGNAIIGGNLVVNGNVKYINVNELTVQDPVIGLGRGPNNTPLTTNDGKDRGTELWYYNTAERSAFIGYQNSTGKLIAAANASLANDVVTVNGLGSFVAGDVEATTVSATGNIVGGNVAGTNLTGTLLTAAQTNITSVGTLSTLSVSGNITSGNVSGATGAFTTVTGNGRALTSLSAANIDTGTLPAARLSGSYSISVTSATSATTAGTVTTAAQPNITSVGTLTALAVTGNITSGNVSGTTGAFTTVTGNGRALTSMNAANIDTGTLPAARLSGTYTITVSGAATTAGTVTTAAQPNITSVGTLSALTVTANTTSGNLLTGGLISATGTVTGSQFNGSGAGLTNLNMANAASGTLAVARGGTGVTTSTGSGAVVLGTSPTFTTQITVPVIVKSGTNAVGNIGQTDNRFNNVFARASSASYADLAEIYLTDSDYPAGTVVIFGGEKEVTASEQYADSRLAGVISTDPAFVMNDGAEGQPIALQGRVPCSVVGNIVKGDLMTTSTIPGVATKLDPADWRPGTVLGKALENYNSKEPGVIEVVVGRV